MSADDPDSRPARAAHVSRSRSRDRAPRLVVAVVDGRGRRVVAPGLARWLVRVAPASLRGELTIALVSDRRMRALNATYRGVDSTTDVLSFPSDASGWLGDVVIASGVAARQAQDAGHSLATELRVLALHGLLHLAGYDHEHADDRGRMARAERRLRARGGLREGLLERGGRR